MMVLVPEWHYKIKSRSGRSCRVCCVRFLIMTSVLAKSVVQAHEGQAQTTHVSGRPIRMADSIYRQLHTPGSAMG